MGRDKQNVSAMVEMLEPRQMLAASPWLVKDLDPRPNSGMVEMAPSTSGRRAYFRAQSWNGTSLWIPDGTAAGTRRAGCSDDFDPIWYHGDLSRIAVEVDEMLFFAGPSSNGRELWRTDGTEAGTLEVMDAVGKRWQVSEIMPFGKGLLLSLSSGRSSRALLVSSDGRPGGRHVIVDGHGQLRSARKPVIAGSMAYFAGKDKAGGWELWRTDGTARGTKRVADLSPGSSGSEPRQLTVVNGSLYFVATTPQHGNKPGTLTLANCLIRPADGGTALKISKGVTATTPGTLTHAPDAPVTLRNPSPDWRGGDNAFDSSSTPDKGYHRISRPAARNE